MKLIPSTILNFQSAAEERIFELLKQINLGPNDVALHSLNLGNHEYKRWGEADFVIVSTKGVLLLEVKGGRVACKNGMWEFKNREGKITRKRESPAAQAGSAFFSLEKNYLRPRFRKELNGVTMGWGVLFEGIERVVTPESSALPELPDEITGYRQDCAGHNTLRTLLERLFSHWQENVHGTTRPLPNHMVTEIVSFLRPNFEQVPPLNSQLNEFHTELCTLTQEQCDRLDDVQENDRIMLLGGAGSGKTFLAMAGARYDAASGLSVLFVTRSPFLAEMLNAHSLPNNVTVCCLGELVARVAEHGPWDTLIIDEGQDMCQMETLDTLDALVSGGWDRGRWRWFGDPNNQISSAYPFDPDALDYLRGLSFQRKLSENIRNAPPIVETLHKVAPVDVGKARSRGLGSEVNVHKVHSDKEIPMRVQKVVSSWVSSSENNVDRSDVAVLCPNEERCGMVVETLKSAGIRAERLSKRALGGRRRKCVLIATIDEFKGLEKPVICVAGLDALGDKERFSLMAYAAFSRANHTLAFVCLEQEAQTMIELEKRRVLENTGLGVLDAG